MKPYFRIAGIALLFVPFLISSCSNDSEKTNQEKPNIVLIVSDDHGSEDAGCYGNEKISTPNIDFLAKHGVRLTNAYCTTASCSASRSVILSGLHNHANGQYGHAHSIFHFSSFDDIRSLPVMLEDEGYRTATIGKYHVAPESVYRFQERFKGVDSRSNVKMADMCRDFINASDQPFFLYYCSSDPHRGGGIDESVPTHPDRFGNREEGYEGVEDMTFSAEDVIVPPYLPDTQATRDELTQYYQSVSRLDQGIGRLIKHLQDAGKWDNTVIMYISDNGIAFPGAKTNLYDPAMRLPCIVKLPGDQNAGTVSDAMITWAYITPTMLDFAGALTDGNRIPGTGTGDETNPSNGNPRFTHFHGTSIKDALETGNSEGFDEIYASHTFHEITMYYPMRVVQDRQYKLIWNIASGLPYPHASDLWESSTWQSALNGGTGLYAKRGVDAYLHRPPYELFDMNTDPDEVVNLADDDDYAEILGEMKMKLKEFMFTTSDPWRVKWEHE